MTVNLYLLTHKCGNNYIQQVHRIARSVPFVKSVQPGQAYNVLKKDAPRSGTFVRCRNFGHDHVMQATAHDPSRFRFVIFTRHPASFVLSATKYHLRGGEAWATTRKQEHLDGMTLNDALHVVKTEAEQQIVVMRHFVDHYRRQSSLMRLLGGDNAIRLKTEDLFTESNESYYHDIAEFVGMNAGSRYSMALMKASPAFRDSLPTHSTGAFKDSSPRDRIVGEAGAYYDEHFLPFQEKLEYV